MAKRIRHSRWVRRPEEEPKFKGWSTSELSLEAIFRKGALYYVPEMSGDLKERSYLGLVVGTGLL